MTVSATPPRESSGYRCEPANLISDQADILSIWSGNLGNAAKQAAKYDWFYLGSEAGCPVVSLLRHEETGRRVGIAAAGPRRAFWNGRDVRIGVLVDLAVLPEHRSLYPALLLQRSLQQSVPGDLAALYGFPNPRAVPVFTRVGYTKTLDFRRFVRVLRSGDYLRRHFPGWLAGLVAWPIDMAMTLVDFLRSPRTKGLKAAWSIAVNPRVDDLWAMAPRGNGPILVRDASFLRWRFDRMPGMSVRYLNVVAADGRLTAWFACEEDGVTLMVRDFWTSAGHDGINPSIVMLLLREARRSAYSAVWLEFGGSERIVQVFEAAGFAERDRRPFFSYIDPESTPVCDAEWYVTSADEDE